ncbi:MAG: NAD(P)-binding domain-containing protein [Candidatus Eremiobacterota bacterium]
MLQDYCPVTVIGAGPAGLSIAYELQTHGVNSIVFEASGNVGNTFVQMTERTEYGPWINNVLRGTTWEPWGAWYRLLARTTRREYAAYLKDYAARHSLNIRLECPVTKVEWTDGRFRLETAQGRIESGALVNCAGYFSRPNVPSYPGADETNIPQMHSSAYRSPATVGARIGKDRGRVLVVGKKLSAGETISELFDAGFEVAVSHRTPIDYWPEIWRESVRSPLLWLDELIRRRLDLGRPEHLKPKMRKTEHSKAIDEGEAPTYPEIERFDKDVVVFKDGSTERFDLVVYATGYQCNLDHLQALRLPSIQEGNPAVRRLESLELPNLFFLGLIGGRSFRSEFLRGIREDAQLLGEILAERVRFSPVPATRERVLARAERD